jgi:hypothetical protein
MAQIKCHACGSSVSEYDAACPHCGARVIPPIPAGPKLYLGRLVIGLIAMAIGAIYLFHLVNKLRHGMEGP